MSTQERAFQFLQELGGEATKKRIAAHARKHDSTDTLVVPKNVGRTLWRLHKSGLVDYEDKGRRSGSGSERTWKVITTKK